MASALQSVGSNDDSLIDLEERDLAHVAAQSGVNPARLGAIQRSQRLARDTGLPADILDTVVGRRATATVDGILSIGPKQRRRAVEVALRRGDLTEDQAQVAKAALEKLDAMAVERAIEAPHEGEGSTLGHLLDEARVPKARQKRLVQAYMAHEGPVEAFWKEVRSNSLVTRDEIDRIQFVLQLGVVTQNHAPMVRALRESGIEAARDLAKLDRSDLAELVDQQHRKVGLPPDLAAAGSTTSDYVDQMYLAIEDAYPTAMIANNLDGLPNADLLERFFSANPDYEGRDLPFESYLSKNSGALKGIPDPYSVLPKRIKGIERILKVAPRGAKVDAVRRLVADGLDSAHKIRTMGPAAFQRTYASILGEAETKLAFQKANNAVSAATVLISNFGAAFNGSTMPVLPKYSEQVDSFANWENMFGTLDFCSCEHCRSVYSPAAYLVDSLAWLSNRNATSGSALDVLFTSRRADIGEIELSCHNTNTLLPYVDLVNEILELEVSPATPAPGYQTEGVAADLAVHPEHLHEPAYEILAAQPSGGRDGVYPFNLPFNLWLTEARFYLAQLGLERHELMTAFHSGGPANAYTDPAVTREALGIGDIEAAIIAGDSLNPNRTLRAYWGMGGTTGWVTKLGNVSTLLEQATPPFEGRMEFEDLLEYLRANFVQATGKVEVWFSDPTCAVDSASVTGLHEAVLERLHRVIRLRRRIGWSVADLDLAIDVLGGGVIDGPLLMKLAVANRLRKTLRLPLAELLSWWGPLDTRRWNGRIRGGRPASIPAGEPGLGMVYHPQLGSYPNAESGESLYDRLFLSKTVADLPNAAFQLTADGNALVDETKSLDDFAPTVAAALNLTAEEIAEVSAILMDQALSLANLSALYRHASLADALDITTRQLIGLIELSGIDPFDPAHPENTIRFVDEAAAVEASGFSIDELDYLLHHRDTKPKSLEPTEDAIGTTLRDLTDGLRQAETDNPAPSDVSEGRTLEELVTFARAVLSNVIPTDHLTAAMVVIDLDPDVVKPSDTEQSQFIDDYLADYVDPVTTKAALIGAAQLTDRTARIRLVIEPLLRYVRRTAVEGTAVQKLAEAFDIDATLLDPVVRSYLHNPATPATSALEVFIDRALIDWEPPDDDVDALPTASELGDQFATYRKLDKASMVLRRFEINREELAWVMQHGPATGTLDLDALPASSGAGAPYEGWARLRDAVHARDEHTNGRLFDLFTSAAEFPTTGNPTTALSNLLDELEERTRWLGADLEHVAGASGFNLQYPADWKDERGLKRLAAAMSVVRRIGLPAADLWAWRIVPTTIAGQKTIAADVKAAARARYDESQWRDVAQTIRDRLRIRQRDALVGWLVAHDGRFEDAAHLYFHFLIDVEMNPCQLTSRIKQAISSTQLFVQRALMSLEPEVTLSPADAREWAWMKNYRVWEANQKVFLYAENWLRPELRDDKSPFFETLENELLQSDVTDESAERAIRTYLESLDQVARLQTVGIYQQKEDETDILHVFARTRSAPHTYFYRQYVDASRWTPWEQVDADIEGDHLLPVVYNRRLILFWPVITEKAIEAVPATPDVSKPGEVTGEEPVRFYQLRLAWTEKQHGKWARTRMSEQRIGETEDDYARLTCSLRKTPLSTIYDYFIRAYELGNGDLVVQPIRAVRQKKEDKKNPAYYKLDRFRMSGCDGTILLEKVSDEERAVVRTPEDTMVAAQHFYGPASTDELELPTQSPLTGAKLMEETLDETPTQFTITPSHQDPSFFSQRPFFFEDEKRSFFVVPIDRFTTKLVDSTAPAWTLADMVPLDFTERYPNVIPRPLPPGPDPWATDPSSQVLIPDAVKVDVPSLDLGETQGLLRIGAAALVSTFGASVGLVDGQPVTGAKRILATNARAKIVGSDGTELLSLASGTFGEADIDGPQLSIETYHHFLAEPVIGYTLVPLLNWVGKNYRFHTFHHPYVCDLMRQLNRKGINGLLDPQPDGPAPLLRRQQKKDEAYFASEYQPVAVAKPYPRDDFDFDGGAYSIYNWELFFHVPFQIAVSLSQNQRFEEALKWFHYIFDPTESSNETAPQRFWKVKPFFQLFHGEDAEAGPIHQLLLLLQYKGSDPDKIHARGMVIAQIAEWRKHPFNPHAIARLRLTAYQKSVVMEYIDTLIDWGDQLFRRDTIESINEATLLYVMAAEILGERPQEVPVAPPQPRTYNDLAALGFDEFGNVLIEEIEGYLAEMPATGDDILDDAPPLLGPTLFFCIPPNQKLLTDYWDRVADRIFKIRNCMNIEGVVRQLALFEPIDPALLVRATAAGLDLGTVLADLYAPMPHHRYRVLAQEALSLCTDVESLGSQLIAALDRRDADELALLHAEHETKLRKAVRQIHSQRIDEAEAALESLKKSKESAQLRNAFYESRSFMNASETAGQLLTGLAGGFEIQANASATAAAFIEAMPNVTFGASGFGGSPHVTTSFGSANFAAAMRGAESIARGVAATLDRAGHIATTLGGYHVRKDEWDHQAELADIEIDNLDKQIAAAEIRVAIANRELDNWDLQIEQSKEVEEYLLGNDSSRARFSTTQLRNWMIGQLSSLYFQAYKLAYDLAKRAERAWQQEIGSTDTSFIEFGYWDGLKKGLLAGQRLRHDLRRMEVAHLAQNRREYELTKHISLRLLDPIALVKLREAGECFVRIPEAWFDMDTPGHYMRRIKSVSVSVPSVTGPYVPVRTTLTLLKNETRVSPSTSGGYARTADDTRFRDDVVGIQSIVTSSAIEDAGLFETSLHDDRYLPFEGAGVISDWRIQLPTTFQQFDYRTISDVVLHIRYTARNGGQTLQTAVVDELDATLTDVVLGSQEKKAAGSKEGLLTAFSVRQDFADAWHAFMNPPDGQTDQVMSIDLNRFPFQFEDKSIKVHGAELLVVTDEVDDYASGMAMKLDLKPSATGASSTLDLKSFPTQYGGLPSAIVDFGATKAPGPWSVTFSEAANAGVTGIVETVDGHLRLKRDAIKDLWLIVRYSVTRS